MNDESQHVSLERYVCLVCGVAYDMGSILLDRRLPQSMERYTTTGWGLCAEHQKFFDDGFVALVECDPDGTGGLYRHVHPIAIKNLIGLELRLETAQCSVGKHRDFPPDHDGFYRQGSGGLQMLRKLHKYSVSGKFLPSKTV